MKMIFLVDGDNNIGTGLQGIDLLTAEDTVLVFFGKGQTLANVKKLCAGTKAQVQYLESVKGGKNSLDHHGAGRPGGQRRGGFRLCHQPGQGL